jgi:thioredoxin reductase (NADPH)
MITPQELKAVPVFECLDDHELQRLAQKAADIRLMQGEWLIREGEQPWFFVLLEGKLQLVKEILGQEQDLDVAHYSRGDFFGEVPILLGSTSLVSIRAEVTSRVARFERQQFQELIQNSAKCSATVLQTMNQRLLRVQKIASDVPATRVLIVGSQYDIDCRDIRSFLSMNRIPYEWLDRGNELDRLPACIPPEIKGPVVVIDHKTWVPDPPTVRGVAEALGMRTTPARDAYDVVIVGGGPAGLAAAVYGASEGLCVLLVERNAAGGQAGTSSRIENYLGFPNGISGDDLSERALRQAERFGAEMVLTREVRKVEVMNAAEASRDSAPERYCVELDGGDRVKTKTLVIATGVDWRRLEAEGVDRFIGRGVLYGAARTEAASVNGKDVFIVGGGNSAGQAAMFFSSYAKSVTILVRGEALDVSMSQYLIEQTSQKDNIHVEALTKVISVGGGDHLESICTMKNGEASKERKADALFVMIGADANTAWLPQELQRDERGYICTGRDLQDIGGWKDLRAPFMLETNLPGCFCAGDVRHDSIKRVSSGVGEGSMAIAFVHQYLALKSKAAG